LGFNDAVNFRMIYIGGRFLSSVHNFNKIIVISIILGLARLGRNTLLHKRIGIVTFNSVQISRETMNRRLSKHSYFLTSYSIIS
jgi:hypothetical protein